MGDIRQRGRLEKVGGKREADKARPGSHTISDVRKVVREQPQVVVIGIGTSGMVSLSRDAEDYLRQAKVNPLVLPSLEAAEKFNQLVWCIANSVSLQDRSLGEAASTDGYHKSQAS